MTVNEKLDEIEARIEAATEGPWTSTEVDLGGKPASEFVRAILAKREADGTSSGRLFLATAANDVDPEMGATVVPALTGDGPRAQVNAHLIAHARTDLPATVKALRAVLELHEAYRPTPTTTYCRGCFQRFPCATVVTITEALDGAE